VGAVRFLNLHEYQSKDLMESYNVIVQRGRMASTPDEAAAVAEEILKANPAAELILKAQIHAGGRGKGTFDNGFKGGVKVCQTAAQVKEFAAKMLGAKLVTKQTGPGGQLCSKVLVNEGITIDKEFYFAILMDRKYGGPVLVASTEGGMDIEEVAEKTPDAIITQPVDIVAGLSDEQAAALAEKLGFKSWLAVDAAKQFKSLYKMFAATDATQVRRRQRPGGWAPARAREPPPPSTPRCVRHPIPHPPPPSAQVEINPLAIGSVPGRKGSTSVFAVDAKLNFDDNAAFRQAPIYAQRDKSMEDARDVAAEEAGLNYVGLDGSIGCMVNGAGLAMATMDIIKLHGGSPANFLDVGGGATSKQVATALKILTSDPNVKAILVNIFGGIMRVSGWPEAPGTPAPVIFAAHTVHTTHAHTHTHYTYRFRRPPVRHHRNGHR
jgi:succinyl-CoA synthetase beta subunit